MFETDKEVLDWYENQPRALSKEYVNSIKWNEIKNYPLNPAFIPVLVYMRDIEYFTDMYYQELRRTPTGKDPVIKKFMDRWSIEELHHGNLLNRFLEEAGFPTGKNWQAEATRTLSPRSTDVPKAKRYSTDQRLDVRTQVSPVRDVLPLLHRRFRLTRG